MQFKLGSLITVLLASQAVQASPVVAREASVTPAEFVSFVNSITQKAMGTGEIVKGITPANAKTQLDTAFKDIQATVKTVESAKAQFGNIQNARITPDDQVKICNAFTGFFNAERGIFDALVAKKDIVNNVQGVPALYPGLRAISIAIDQIPVKLLGNIWPCGVDVGKSITAFGQTLKQAVGAFA